MYKLIAIGGTFDRLHRGHRYFISKAFEYGKRVVIGLTSDEYAIKKSKIKSQKLKIQLKNQKEAQNHSDSASWRSPGVNVCKIDSYKERKKELEDFLKQKGFIKRAEIVKINDIYGPTIEENKIEALLVTSETARGAIAINKRRRLKQLKPLKVVKISLILADDRKRIASFRIRLGEINRWGRVYISKINPPAGGRRSKINEKIRQELKKPQGILIKGNLKQPEKLGIKLKKIVSTIQPVVISTIGDEVTKLCNEGGIAMNMAVIDYKIGRRKVFNSLSDLGFSKALFPGPTLKGVDMTVRNPPGYITRSLVKAIKNGYVRVISGEVRSTFIIRVIGEEDLAGMPAILLSPLDSIVLYGQPGEGAVMVEITEEKKQELLGLLKNIFK